MSYTGRVRIFRREISGREDSRLNFAVYHAEVGTTVRTCVEVKSGEYGGEELRVDLVDREQIRSLALQLLKAADWAEFRESELLDEAAYSMTRLLENNKHEENEAGCSGSEQPRTKETVYL